MNGTAKVREFPVLMRGHRDTLCLATNRSFCYIATTHPMWLFQIDIPICVRRIVPRRVAVLRARWTALQVVLMLVLPNAFSATFVVTNTEDQGPGSFRQALLDASQSPGVDDITFSNVSGTITLLSTPPPFADVNILGPGARQLTINTPHVGAGGSSTTCIISGLRFTYNAAAEGTNFFLGGIIGSGGNLWLRDCEITSARMYVAQGAGINSMGTLIMSGCTVFGNSVWAFGTLYPQKDCQAGAGGGLYVTAGSAFITNCTFTGNSATSYLWCNGTGGAVAVNNGANAYFVNCTLVGNSAAVGPAIYNYGGNVTLLNTIVTEPVSGVTLLGGNLLTNDYTGLGPLQDNGGPTLTCALASNSPAINMAQSLGAPATDQRGVSRPQGTRPDIGAFEFEVPSNYFQLVLTAIGPGTVLRNPDQVFFPSNTVVTLTAFPQEDYGLTEWSGDASGQQNPLSVVMDTDKAIAATFQYAPTTVTNASGTTNYVLNTNGWGPSSFRQAIRDLNASGGGTIRFSNVAGVITLPLGLPPLEAPFKISGPGSSKLLLSIPNGGDAFVVNPGITGRISGVTIQASQTAGGSGGAISNGGRLVLRQVDFHYCTTSNGGAIFNGDSLQVSACTFSNNFAKSGGAIYNSGDLLLEGSIFSANGCTTSPQDINRGGGALYNAAGEARIANCVFTGNKTVGTSGPFNDPYSGIPGGTALGGAIYSSEGAIWLANCLMSSNEVQGGNGGLDALGHYAGNGGNACGAGIYMAGGTLALTNCALVYNRGDGGDSPSGSRSFSSAGQASGGAVFARAGSLLCGNCTFSGNEVRSGVNGILISGPSGMDALGGACAVNATSTFVNCTVTANHAFGGTNVYAGPPGSGRGAGIWTYGSGTAGTVALESTIVSSNFGTRTNQGPIADDVYGPAQSLGHNIIGTTTGMTNIVSTDLMGVDPRLGPLQNNGGPTPTHALLAGSPAIDAGAPTTAPFDQRGQPRTIDDPAVSNSNGSDGTDIGAFESNPVLSLTGVSILGGDVGVGFTTISTNTYQLQYKEQVTDSTWVTLPGIISGTGGIVTATNTGAAFLPERFYRVFTR